MKRLVAVLCLMFILMGTLTSCMGSSVRKFFKDFEFEEEKSVTKVTQLTAIDGYTSLNNDTQILTLRDNVNNLIKFYNVNRDKIVLSVNANDVIGREVFYFGDSAFIKVSTSGSNSQPSTRIYDNEGSLVCEKKGYYTGVINCSLDLFQFNGIIYRVDKNGKAKEVVNNPLFGSLPSFDMRTEKYYYDVNREYVSVYDYSLEMVYYWEIPHADVFQSQIHVINKDRLLVQYLELLPDEEKQYDVFLQGRKFKLTSLVINVKNGNERKLNLDYVVSDVEYVRNEILDDDYLDFIPSGINTLAEVQMIDDKRVTGDMGTKILSLNNNGKMKTELFGEFGSIVEPIAKNRFLATDRSGITYLLDEKGEKLGRFDASSARYNEKYIISNNKMYNYDLQQVYDFDVEGKSVAHVFNKSVLMKDTSGNYYIYTKSGEVKSIGKKVENLHDSFYIVKESTGSTNQFTVYDEDGNAINATITGNYIEKITEGDGYSIIVVNRDGKSYYYKVS